MRCLLIGVATFVWGSLAFGAAPTVAVAPELPAVVGIQPAEKLPTRVMANAVQSDPAKLATLGV